MNAPIPATAFRAADRLGAIGVSEIVRLTQEANQLKRQGQPVIVLGLGEPDFDTPAHILVTVRDRKDPRRKDGNDQRVPLLAVGGMIMQQYTIEW